MHYQTKAIAINVIMLKISKVILLFILLSQLSACTNTEPRITPQAENFCADINETNKYLLDEQLAPFAEKMQKSTGVYVLEEGTEAMLSRAWLSEHAQKTIDVQYFIFSTDNIGLIAIDYLVKAAERGVKVRILVDDIMVDARGDELLKLAAHPNLSIKIYNPVANIGKNIVDKVITLTTNFHGLNQRMHNKTFTVDGKISITGGRNVADEYFGYDHTFNFRDRDVLLLGQATQTINHSFNDFWQSPLSISVTELVSHKELPNLNYQDLHQYACNPLNFVPKVRKQIKQIPQAFQAIQRSGKLQWVTGVEYISDKPGKNNANKFLAGSGESTKRLISLAQSAKKSITIQTPYLVTTDLGKNLFKSLVNKGIEVRILTNSLASNDNLEAFSGYQRDRTALLETGIELYEFKPDAQIRQKVMSEVMQGQLQQMPVFGLHAKTMVIDDDVAIIGTFNLDPRSANLNTESITIIPSKQIATAVKAGMIEEMQPENAWRITHDWNPDGEVSKLKQLKVKLRRIVPKDIL